MPNQNPPLHTQLFMNLNRLSAYNNALAMTGLIYPYIIQFIEDDSASALADALNMAIDINPRYLNLLCSCLLEKLTLSAEIRVVILKRQALCLDKLQSIKGLTVTVRKLIDESPYPALQEACDIHLQEGYYAYRARLCDLLAQDSVPKHLNNNMEWHALSIKPRIEVLAKQLVDDEREIYAVLRYKEACYLALSGRYRQMYYSLSESFFIHENFFAEMIGRYEAVVNCPRFARNIQMYLQRSKTTVTTVQLSEQETEAPILNRFPSLVTALVVADSVSPTADEEQSLLTDLQKGELGDTAPEDVTKKRQLTPTPPRAFLQHNPYLRCWSHAQEDNEVQTATTSLRSTRGPTTLR